MFAMTRPSVLEVESRGWSTARNVLSFIVSVLSILSTPASSNPRSTYTYIYEGQPFSIHGENLLSGATHISIKFSVSSLLSTNTTYNVTTPPFQDLVMSDGVNTIKKGTFLNSSFITTNGAGDITTWAIDELLGRVELSFLAINVAQSVIRHFCLVIVTLVPQMLAFKLMGSLILGRELALHTTMVRRVCGQFPFLNLSLKG
jgi:hypothetical protein